MSLTFCWLTRIGIIPFPRTVSWAIFNFRDLRQMLLRGRCSLVNACFWKFIVQEFCPVSSTRWKLLPLKVGSTSTVCDLAFSFFSGEEGLFPDFSSSCSLFSCFCFEQNIKRQKVIMAAEKFQKLLTFEIIEISLAVKLAYLALLNFIDELSQIIYCPFPSSFHFSIFPIFIGLLSLYFIHRCLLKTKGVKIEHLIRKTKE